MRGGGRRSPTVSDRFETHPQTTLTPIDRPPAKRENGSRGLFVFRFLGRGSPEPTICIEMARVCYDSGLIVPGGDRYAMSVEVSCSYERSKTMRSTTWKILVAGLLILSFTLFPVLVFCTAHSHCVNFSHD